MRKPKLIYELAFAWALLSVAPSLSAQETFPVNGVADPRHGYYAFTNATIVKDATTTLTNATLVIKDGKITIPLKGATLIGSGPEALKYVRMVGNDSQLDKGIGVCGKAGQSVPVGVGQPTLLIDNMTVGGTA